jgi:1-deoxy-D-xylulose-5-phosphate reductoisomerase
MVNKILELIEAQKLFEIPDEKIDIIIHPNSLVHALVELNNGLFELIYHETSMIIPIANAIFDGNLKIEDFYKEKKSIFKEKLIFKNIDKKRFPIIKIRNFLNKFPFSGIILNASNEILVDQFLKKKIPFLAISKIIMSILRDRNYTQNAIVIPKNLNQIIELDNWARKKTFSIINKFYG